jgi:hypothetical protein
VILPTVNRLKVNAYISSVIARTQRVAMETWQSMYSKYLSTSNWLKIKQIHEIHGLPRPATGHASLAVALLAITELDHLPTPSEACPC